MGSSVPDDLLRPIMAALDAGDLVEAQRLLVLLDEPMRRNPSTSVLAVRLLYERGKIDERGVIERLEDLFARDGPSEALTQMLDNAVAGKLTRLRDRTIPTPRASLRTEPTPPPPGSWPPSSERASARRTERTPSPRSAPPDVAVTDGATLHSPPPVRSAPAQAFDTQRTPADGTPRPDIEIPRAPAVPRIAPPRDLVPSYAPATLPLKRPFGSEPPNVQIDSGSGRVEQVFPEIVRIDHIGLQKPPIRSGRPATVEAHAKASVVSIARLLDEGLVAQALSELDRVDAEGDPQLLLLRARALADANRAADALLAAQRLAAAPLVEPEVRAGCAKLLIVLHEPGLALIQARRACFEDPECLLARQALAWALVRVGWTLNDRDAALQASQLLEHEPTGGGRGWPQPGALEACIEALSGDAATALAMAEGVLDEDENSLDALAAQAVACARLSKDEQALGGWLRLARIAPRAGSSLKEVLAAFGVRFARRG
jgi:hypothetical protein